jgi:hypothetical protein
MAEYPPKLQAVEESPFGSILTLSDGSRVPIDVRQSRLDEVLTEYSSRSLSELVSSRSLGVYVGALQAPRTNGQG